MKIAVIYYSKTGHSKKIADAVAESLETKALDINTKPELNDVELLFIVSGIYGGVTAPELNQFAQGISKSSVKKAALITSCLSNRQGQDIVRNVLIKNGIEVAAEEFICRGRLLFIGFPHPDKADISAAISFAKKITQKE